MTWATGLVLSFCTLQALAAIAYAWQGDLPRGAFWAGIVYVNLCTLKIGG